MDKESESNVRPEGSYPTAYLNMYPKTSFETIQAPARVMESEKLRRILRRKEMKEVRKCTRIVQYETLGDDKNYNLAAVLESIESSPNHHSSSISNNHNPTNGNNNNNSTNHHHHQNHHNSVHSSSSLQRHSSPNAAASHHNAASGLSHPSSVSSKDSRKEKRGGGKRGSLG
eukprot:TRINITY_DN4524_c0_g1_i1.p1 TRINITY_DN4524_c0_g1~~TRINITY_DN4524_c0_g1_i1.p1  ORF type:complete len:172 (-),score=73.80 TRINITY_DN4524_c0_g1_i1:2486-3001(-)